MIYVWKYFQDLDSRRGRMSIYLGESVKIQPLPLQYSEILAYFNLYKIRYVPAEISLIEVLDGIAINHYNKVLSTKPK